MTVKCIMLCKWIRFQKNAYYESLLMGCDWNIWWRFKFLKDTFPLISFKLIPLVSNTLIPLLLSLSEALLEVCSHECIYEHDKRCSDAPTENHPTRSQACENIRMCPQPFAVLDLAPWKCGFSPKRKWPWTVRIAFLIDSGHKGSHNGGTKDTTKEQFPQVAWVLKNVFKARERGVFWAQSVATCLLA